MKTEFEVKILDIDISNIKKKLESAGAKFVAERMMKRKIYDLKSAKKSWIRLRDDGEKVTLAIKEFQANKIDGTKELEVGVSSFHDTAAILHNLGFNARQYQENKRTSYKFGNARLEIDQWPLIPAYLEVEADSAEEVRKVVDLLGFKMNQTTSVDVESVYRKYGLELNLYNELKL